MKRIQNDYLKISSFFNKRLLSLSFIGLAFMALIVSCDSMQSVGNETGQVNQTVQELTLIDGKGNLSVTVQKGNESYFTLDLGSAEADLYPAVTVYNGWCASPTQQIKTGNQTHHGVSLFTTFNQEKWKPVNYLLNHKETLLIGDSELTQKEIQAAIWSLMNISDFNLTDINVAHLPEDMKSGGLPTFNVVKTEEIVNHVNNNYRSFEYTENSTYAVVVNNASGQQRMIIENSRYFITVSDLRETYGLTVAWDINDSGEIVGGNTHVAADGTLTTMGSMFARAINNNGQVVGNNGKVPVIWDAVSGQKALHTPNGDWIEAKDINIYGQIVGEFVEEHLLYEDEEYGNYYDYDFSAFIWDENQEVRLINDDGWAQGINDHGSAVGVDYSVQNRAFVWDEQNGTKGLGVYSGFSSGRANAINNDGQVVGSVLVAGNSGNNLMASSTTGNSKQTIREMDRLLQATQTKGVYDQSHVIEMLRSASFKSVGFPWEKDLTINTDKKESDRFEVSSFSDVIYSNTYRSEAFIWDESVGMTGMGTLGGEWSTAWDVNDFGHSVGYSSSEPGISHAFFWYKDLGMIELPSFGGNSLARAINNEGQIVGYSYDSDGNFYPVIWEIKFSTL